VQESEDVTLLWIRICPCALWAFVHQFASFFHRDLQACANGHTAVVRLLLGMANEDPAAEDNYAVKMAAANGHVEVLAMLLTDVCRKPGWV
jgi:hypothetical protein